MTDEDTFTVPAAWAALRYPRRGDEPEPAAEPVDLAGVLEVDGTALRRRFDKPESEQPLVRAALDWLGGEHTPLGVAAVLASYRLPMVAARRPALDGVARALVERHGVAFAAQAAVHFAGLQPFAWHGFRRQAHLRRRTAHADTWEFGDDSALRFAGEVRTALAEASPADFTAAVEAVEPLRDAEWHAFEDPSWVPRVTTSFLVPTRDDWVERDFADFARNPRSVAGGILLAGAASTPEHVALIREPVRGRVAVVGWRLVHTVAASCGPAAAPALTAWADDRRDAVDVRRAVLDLLADLPGDEPFRLLIDRAGDSVPSPALAAATLRYPRRAVRLLAETAGQPGIGGLFRAHVLRHREVAEQVAGELTGVAARRVRALLDEESAAIAPDATLPAVLVRPRWREKRKRLAPVVVEGLAYDGRPATAWAPGERDRWRTNLDDVYYWGVTTWNPADWDKDAADQDRGTIDAFHQIRFFLRGPDALVAPRLDGWRPDKPYQPELWARNVAARWETAALPAILHVVRQRPAALGPLLSPYVSTELAALMADWYLRLKSGRPHAVTWLRRHADFAARTLVPRALAAPGPDRTAAERALRLLDPALVRTAAAGYGPDAVAGIDALLAADPLDAVPARAPKAPAWLDPALLTRVRLAGTETVLGPDAVGHLLTMLAFTALDDPYAGLADVKAACDPASLDRFAQSLLDAWRLAGYPAKDGWVLTGAGLLGGDETVRQLSALIQAWPGESASRRASNGLDVLAAIGSELALMHLDRIGRKVKFKGLRERAAEKVAQIAAELGLSDDQLADRLVPDFGLDENGSMLLDYGPRRFTVGFDEQLRPSVRDDAGKLRKVLPRPAAGDDEERAAAAYALFAGLKKDVKAVAADELRRLERALSSGRTWKGGEFARYLAGHPLIWHVARRLLWQVLPGAAPQASRPQPDGPFRLAEDRTYADADDKPVHVADDAEIRLVHPLTLDPAALASWSEVFADYEILQPFGQLGREVYRLTPEQAAGRELDRFAGRTAPAGPLLGLDHKGWLPESGGDRYRLRREVGTGLVVTVPLEPGIVVLYGEYEDQKLGILTLTGRDDATLADADPVLISETLRDLERVTS